MNENLTGMSTIALRKIIAIKNAYAALDPIEKTSALDVILANSGVQQIAHLNTVLPLISKIDFISTLPNEIACRILQRLDGKSLTRCAQVSKKWNALADDDLLWFRLCSQHIDKKCTKCGWVFLSNDRVSP